MKKNQLTRISEFVDNLEQTTLNSENQSFMLDIKGGYEGIDVNYTASCPPLVNYTVPCPPPDDNGQYFCYMVTDAFKCPPNTNLACQKRNDILPCMP